MGLVRLAAGELAPILELETLAGTAVRIPDPDRAVHVQFRRFAGCPICNLHLRRVAQRISEITDAGIREVVLFHSEPETMRTFQGDLPFDVVADPQRHAYDRYGVGSSVRSILDPRAWGGYLRGMFARHASSSVKGEGGHTGLPADFLILPSGVIHAVKYGVHADDQWSVDELLATAGRQAA